MDYIGMATLVAAVAALVGALAAAITSVINALRLARVARAIDGRLTELLDLTRKSSLMEGVLAEKTRQTDAELPLPPLPGPASPLAPGAGGPHP